MALLPSDRVETGSEYTFRVQSGNLVLEPTAESMAADLARFNRNFQSVRASRGLFSGVWAFQFTWAGPRDRVESVATQLLEALDMTSFTPFGSWVFLDAESGRVRQPVDPFGPGEASDDDPLPSLTTVAIYVLVLVVIAAFAFGFAKEGLPRIIAEAA